MVAQENQNNERYQLLQEEIPIVYNKIAELERTNADNSLDTEIEQTRIHLDSLLKEAADYVEKALDDRLLMPIDAGNQVLEEVKKLRKKYGGMS